jgi:hypothetical protein
MADPERPATTDDYLARVATHLGLPEPHAGEVHDELAAHLDDATAALIAEGLTPEQAEREAIARLGSPEVLADALRGARQTRRRLLAGAAGGIWAAVGGGIGGTLIGYGLLMAVVLLIAVLGAILNRFIRFNWSVDPDVPYQAWNTALAAGALCVGAFLGARRAVQATAARSLRSVRAIGPWWALGGAVVLGLWVLFILRMPLGWPAVAAELLIPASFAAGATVMIERPGPRIRMRHILLVAVVGFVLPVVLLYGASRQVSGALSEVGGGPYASVDEMWRAQHYDLIGRRPPDDVAAAFADGGSSFNDGLLTPYIDVSAAVDLSGWHDFRFEAWRRPAPGVISPDPNFRTPFVTAPAVLEGTRFQATLRVDRTPGVIFYGLVLTGVGPDGERYLLSGPNGGQTAFVGTIWEWLTAQ